MQTVQVNSLTSRKTTGIPDHFGCWHNLMHRYNSLPMRLNQEQGAISCPWSSTGHCLETLKLEPPTVLISGYGDFPLKNQGLSIALFLIGNQAPKKAVFQVTDTRGYLILGCGNGTINRLHTTLPNDNPTKVYTTTQGEAHLKTIMTEAPKQNDTGRIGHNLRQPNIQLLDSAVHIDGKKHNLPITKE